MYTDILSSLQRRADELAKQYPELDRIRLQLDVPNFNVEDIAPLLERTVTAEVALSATDNTADPVSYVYTYCYTWGFDLQGRRCHRCGKVCTLIERDQCDDCGGAAIVRAVRSHEGIPCRFCGTEDTSGECDACTIRADIKQDQRRED